MTVQWRMTVAVKRGQGWRSNYCVAVDESMLDAATEVP